jgi:uncharacterized protein involved in exopolysaccharide biosynthesis
VSPQITLPTAPEHHATASKETRDEAELSLLDLLIVLAERKSLILKVTGFFSLLAGITAIVLPSRYTATATLLPPAQNSSIASNFAAQLGNLGGLASAATTGSLGLKSPNEMYVAMLKSRTVEDGMVQQYRLADEYHDRLASDAREDLERHVTVDGSGKDGLIRISVQDHDPTRAAELANGYVSQFRQLSDRLAITEASQRRLFFEQQLVQAKDNLAKAEEALKQTEQQTGILQLDSQARALIESAATLRAQITAKEVQITSLQTFATDQNAQLVQAQHELESLRAQLARLGGSESTDSGLLLPRGKVPQAGMEYVRKFRDTKYYETIFDILARQFEFAKLDEAKEGAPIQIVDVAIPPDKRSFPKRRIIVLSAALAGLVIGSLCAFVQAIVGAMRRDEVTDEKVRLLRNALSFKRS